MKPILLVSLFVFSIAAAPAQAAKPQARFACVASLECANASSRLPLDLPSDESTLVRAADSNTAIANCMKDYESAYAILQRTAPQGCTVTSNAFQVERTPASNR